VNDSDGRVGVFCADFLNLISASSIIDQKRKTYTCDFQPDRTGTDDDDLARLPNLLLILHKRLPVFILGRIWLGAHRRRLLSSSCDDAFLRQPLGQHLAERWCKVTHEERDLGGPLEWLLQDDRRPL